MNPCQLPPPQVDRFYNKVIADPTVSPYFSATDMQKQRSKQTAFLAYALVSERAFGQGFAGKWPLARARANSCSCLHVTCA